MIKGVDYTGVSVVPMCHDGKGKYLVSLRGPGCRDEQGRWEPAGGGGVHFGETLNDALVREIEEECGAHASHIEHMGFREVFREKDGVASHWIVFDYRVLIDPKDVYITEPDKCLELRWCTLPDIPTPQHSQFPFFLEKYKDKLMPLQDA